jgi:hypothetical protein
MTVEISPVGLSRYFSYLVQNSKSLPQAHIPDQDRVDQLYDQMLTEMLSDEFVGIIYMLTAWGKKP